MRVRFSLKYLLVAITLICIWLATQVQWITRRNEALVWLKDHDINNWSTRNPNEVELTDQAGTRPYRVRSVPLIVRISGAPQVPFIYLDKAKLSNSDAEYIDSLQSLFPEAEGIHIHGPGGLHRWPPEDPDEFLN